MEHLSGSTTVLDSRSRLSYTQCHHWEGVHSLLLQWLCPAPVTCWRRSIIWLLHDHIEWCLWTGTCIRRYWIWKWEQMSECSYSPAPKTMTITCFHTRKFIFWTCHFKSTPISQLPPHSMPLTDLWRTWWTLNRVQNGKLLTWGWYTGLPLSQHSRRRRQWCRRTLPNSIPWWWFLDGRTCPTDTLVNTWKCATWSVPLSVSKQFESVTPHARRSPTVHRPQ